ncbi:hypothetical protein ACLOJK_026246 [Asimina triloba]
MQEVSNAGEIPPNKTIYINNLNEKIKLDELKKSLHAVFSQFGKILEVLAFKTLKHKGQAWVVFEDVSSATNALRQMQGFPFYDKPMRIQYAKTKSDVIAKADGTFVPRERRKRHEERGQLNSSNKDSKTPSRGHKSDENLKPKAPILPHRECLRQKDAEHYLVELPESVFLKKKRREQLHDASQAGLGMNPAYAGAYGVAPPLSQLPYPGGAKSMLPEAPAPPNNILFIQNVPHETTPMMLQMLFCQYPGFKEVRMVEAKPGIAFVEYGDEMQSTVAMQGLQGFKISPQNPMVVTYAKK